MIVYILVSMVAFLIGLIVGVLTESWWMGVTTAGAVFGVGFGVTLTLILRKSRAEKAGN